jgi:hypothetical protein
MQLAELKLKDNIMAWLNQKNGQIIDQRPERIRLENSMTITGSELTDQVLAEHGWIWTDYDWHQDFVLPGENNA